MSKIHTFKVHKHVHTVSKIHTFKLHKHDNALAKTLFRVRPAEPRADTWWFACLAVVSIYSYGSSDRSLVARRELMTHNTSFDRRFYRAERILAVRAAIRASRSAVWARLEPHQKQLPYFDPHDQTNSGAIQINTQCVSEVPRTGESGSRQASGSSYWFPVLFFNYD